MRSEESLFFPLYSVFLAAAFLTFGVRCDLNKALARRIAAYKGNKCDGVNDLFIKNDCSNGEISILRDFREI